MLSYCNIAKLKIMQKKVEAKQQNMESRRKLNKRVQVFVVMFDSDASSNTKNSLCPWMLAALPYVMYFNYRKKSFFKCIKFS